MGKGTILIKTDIKRDNMKLYYCGTEDGFVTVCVTDQARGRKKKK